MNKSIKTYDVSIAVISYNPQWYQIKRTIDSILIQKEVNFQIVISDDASKNNYFDQLEEYFLSKNFHDYKFISHSINQGTVLNCLDGYSASDSQYVKDLSPGDMLYGENVLHNWLCKIIETKSDICFSDTVYYKNIDENYVDIVRTHAYPQRIDLFKLGGDKLRKDYLLSNDLCVGVGMLCSKALLIKYITEISHKVKYAEDNMYRLAMFDRVKTSWFDNNSVLYEWGGGFSTGNGRTDWPAELVNDYNETNELLYNRIHFSKHKKNTFREKIFFRQLSRALKWNGFGCSGISARFRMWYIYLTIPYVFLNRVYQLIHGIRHTPSEINSTFLNSMNVLLLKSDDENK